MQELNARAHDANSNSNFRPNMAMTYYLTLYTPNAIGTCALFLHSISCVSLRVCRWFSCQYNHISSISTAHTKKNSGTVDKNLRLAYFFNHFLFVFFSFGRCQNQYIWSSKPFVLSSTNIAVIDSETITVFQYSKRDECSSSY